MQAIQGVLKARLHLPQASQLAQCAAANDKIGVSGAHLRTVLLLPSSQFFSGTGVIGSRDSEPCSSACSSGYSSGGAKVVCMAKERRVKMVAQQIKREISEMLVYDNVLQAAVLPETALGADMYLTAVATITDVEMSKDLSVAKVYISIYGDDRGQEKALEGLKNRAPYVRKQLAQRMNLKSTPEVRFIKDEALERGSRVIAILDKLKKERQAKTGTGAIDGNEVDAIYQEDSYEDSEDDVGNKAGESKSITNFSKSKDEGDESDWDDAENIIFIK